MHSRINRDSYCILLITFCSCFDRLNIVFYSPIRNIVSVFCIAVLFFLIIIILHLQKKPKTQNNYIWCSSIPTVNHLVSRSDQHLRTLLILFTCKSILIFFKYYVSLANKHMWRSKLIFFQRDTTQISNINKEYGSPALHLYLSYNPACICSSFVSQQPFYKQEGAISLCSSSSLLWTSLWT